MARRTHGTRIALTRGPDRQTVWATFSLGAMAVAANTVVLLSSLNAAALALRPFTIIRTRLIVQWENDVFTATEAPFGAVGDIVVSENAAAAGAASVPGPISEGDDDWLWYQPMITRLVVTDATGKLSPAGNQYVVDSKAMRKVGINDQVVTVVENNDPASGARINIVGRQLFKLH